MPAQFAAAQQRAMAMRNARVERDFLRQMKAARNFDGMAPNSTHKKRLQNLWNMTNLWA